MTAVRLLIAALAALGALAGRRTARPSASVGAPSTGVRAADPESSAPPVPRGVRVARALLIAAGALLTGVAFGLIAAGVPAGQWLGIAVWLGGALVLHDALLAPLLLVVMRVLRRADAVVPWRAIAAVEVVLVTAGALTLLAFPAIRAQAVGARNGSVLVFDYGAHLAVVWALAGVLVVALALAGVLVRRRSRSVAVPS